MTYGKTIVAGVLVLIALVAGVFFSGSSASTDNVGGTPREVRDWFVNGISLGKSPVAMDWAVKTIGAGQDQVVVYNNTTGHDIIADYGELQLIANAAGTQTASSTYNVSIIATSTSVVPDSHDFTALVADKYKFVVGPWATSTTATTSNSVGSVPLGGQGAVRIPSGWYLIAYIQRNTTQCSGAAAAICESATSSVRGFDIKARARIHYDDPSR